jgi:pyridoxamine 5'-phosphate oxidase
MNAERILGRLQEILYAHGAGILATVGEDGKPHVRWLTSYIFPNRPHLIYALTVPSFPKIGQLRSNPHVEWMFQSPTLDEVITVRGRINIVDNPSLRSEILEAVGGRMRALWKLADDVRDLSVLETVVDEATRYLPLEGSKDTVPIG